VTLAGGVRVGELTHIGVGSSIIQGISIGKSSIVGAGSVVVRAYSKLYHILWTTPAGL